MNTALTYLCSLVLAVTCISGCASSKETVDEGTEGSVVRMADAITEVRQARIFLDGVDKGLTPKVLRIDRRFGYSEVLLRIGKERVRLFEIEQAVGSSNASELIYSFKGKTDGLYTQYNVEELPKKNDKYVYIPFRAEPMHITDRQYGIELLVY